MALKSDTETDQNLIWLFTSYKVFYWIFHVSDDHNLKAPDYAIVLSNAHPGGEPVDSYCRKTYYSVLVKYGV